MNLVLINVIIIFRNGLASESNSDMPRFFKHLTPILRKHVTAANTCAFSGTADIQSARQSAFNSSAFNGFKSRVTVNRHESIVNTYVHIS